MTTGQIIKKVRQAKGITQQELADRLGISYVGVSQWETDKRNPKQDTLVRIAKALDVPVGYLYGSDRIISNRELYENVSRMLDRAHDRLNTAKEDNDGDSIERWERVVSELHKIVNEATNEYSYGELPEDTGKLIDMFDRLNGKGRKKVLEWVSDFCKIPEYQAAPVQPRQESSQGEQ